MTDEQVELIADALKSIAVSINDLGVAVQDLASSMPHIPLDAERKGIAVHCECYVHKG